MSSFNSRSHGLARARHGVRTVLEMLRTLAGSVTGNRPHGAPQGNAFDKAVRSPEDMLGELKRQAMTLTPLGKRRLFDGVTGSARSRSPTRRGACSWATIRGWTPTAWSPGSCSAGRRR